MNFKRFVISIASVCFVLAFVAGPAQAADTPTSDAYSGVAGQVGSGGDSPEQSETAAAEDEGAAAPIETSETEPVADTSEVETSESGTLPFTGFQAGFLALVAVALLGFGVVLRRRTRHTT